jgi:hypothetical protein
MRSWLSVRRFGRGLDVARPAAFIVIPSARWPQGLRFAHPLRGLRPLTPTRARDFGFWCLEWLGVGNVVCAFR